MSSSDVFLRRTRDHDWLILERGKRDERERIEEDGIEKREIEIREEMVWVCKRGIEKGFLFVTVCTNS